jgi:hypothetical protein
LFLRPELLESVPDNCVAVVVTEWVNHTDDADGFAPWNGLAGDG